MSLRWLFRVDVASERESSDKKKTRGLGHAYKCIALAQTVENADATVQFSVEGASDVQRFFQQRGYSYKLNEDHLSVVDSYDPDVIVTDINYLEIETIRQFRERSLTVNIAPRGDCKYYANLSFTCDRIADSAKPDDVPEHTWYGSPKYAILNPEFSDLRQKIDSTEVDRERNGVIVQMGGVDKFDMTGDVLRALDPTLFSHCPLTVVAGPYNPHVTELRGLTAAFENSKFVVDPENYASLVADHELAIFGTGISTYEGAAVGVPSINLGHSEFHDLRGEKLEQLGFANYLGRHDTFDSDTLNEEINHLLTDSNQLEQMRATGTELVDGLGPTRIVSTITGELI